MRIFYSMLFMAVALCASAQNENDTVKVRMDFNENPWGMATCPYNVKDNGKTDWSHPSYEPKESRLDKVTVFEIPACGGNVTVTVTPSDIDETDWDNAMVRDENYNNNDIVETFLYTYTGSVMTFKAPEGYYMTKVAIDTYRTWASGGLYSGDATNGQHVWGPDSVKVRTYEVGGVEYSYDSWSGDSVEWSLPPVTSSTKFRYIDFWLLPLKEDADAVTAVAVKDDECVTVTNANGVVVRRSRRANALDGLPKGIYIVEGRKVAVE